jgi:flagellar basal-body rod protein FlgC
MAMSIASSIAASGMNVAALRLQVSASNVANVLSDGPLSGSNNSNSYPSAYVPLRVDQIDTVGGGTSATVSPISPSAVPVFDPTAPYANQDGLEASPNVDLASAMIQQIIASYTFAGNAKVMQIAGQMTAALLNITA